MRTAHATPRPSKPTVEAGGLRRERRELADRLLVVARGEQLSITPNHLWSSRLRFSDVLTTARPPKMPTRLVSRRPTARVGKQLGLRVSEAVGADIEDLGEQERHRVLHLKGKGQRTKASVAPLNAAVAHAVDQARAGRSHGPLLITATGRRLTRQHAGKLIKRLGEQIGLPSLHPHALRHGFVTISLDEGASLCDVQDAARHADPRTTRRYDKNRNSLNRHPTHRLLGALEP